MYYNIQLPLLTFSFCSVAKDTVKCATESLESRGADCIGVLQGVSAGWSARASAKVFWCFPISVPRFLATSVMLEWSSESLYYISRRNVFHGLDWAHGLVE